MHARTLQLGSSATAASSITQYHFTSNYPKSSKCSKNFFGASLSLQHFVQEATWHARSRFVVRWSMPLAYYLVIQTARKFTGGKAPRKFVHEQQHDDEVENMPPTNSAFGTNQQFGCVQSSSFEGTLDTNSRIMHNNTYTCYADQISSSPNQASLTSFNPFTHAASPVKSTSSFRANEETSSGFQYASSIEDFLNPGAVADDEDSPFQTHHYPYQPHEHYPSSHTTSTTHSEYHIRLPEGGTINLGNFFNTPAGRGNP